MASDGANPKPTPAQVGLGLLILWQIIFMISANVLGVIPHGAPEADELSDNRAIAVDSSDRVLGQRLVDATAAVMDAWAQSTGQPQAWWLFGPTFPVASPFPVVELRWDDGKHPPVRLDSVIEPKDPSAYLRLPSSDRLLHYEIRLSLLYTIWCPEFENSELTPQWRELMGERVSRQWKSIRAYLRWKTDSYLSAHPDLPPPREAILFMHIYRTPELGKPLTWTKAEICVARWRMHDPPAPGMLPVEMCDPLTGQFVPLPKERSASHE